MIRAKVWITKRAWAAAVLIASFALIAGACSDDSDDMDGGAGTTDAGTTGASASGGTSGSGGTSTTSGNGATSGDGATAGANATGGSSGTAGTGGVSGAAGASGAAGGECELECNPGQHCELMEVTCIQAPCLPVPTCVEDEGSGSAPCGGRGGNACAEDSFCDFAPAAICGRADAPGSCAIKPTGCTFEFAPVCGCDGEDYPNACAANAEGVSVDHAGECGSASGALFDCAIDDVACDSLPPECDEGQAPTQAGACYGPCVAIEQCACDGPSDCPNEGSYTCHMSAGHCGPYV